MGMKDRAIQIVYELKDAFNKKLSKITGGMRKIESASKKSTSKIESYNNKLSASYSKLSSSIGPVKVAALGVVAAIVGLGAKIKEWTAAANIQERADKKLETSLRNLSGATQEQIQALKDQAAALQETTGYEDAAIISAQAMLATFQLTAGQIEQLTPRLLDAAEGVRVMGRESVDMEAIAKALGKAFTSGVGGLADYGIAMTDAQKTAFGAADQAGKVALLVKILDDNYKGLAVSVGNLYEGAQRKANAAQKDAEESLGGLFTKSKSWIGLSKSIAKAWKAIASGVSDSADEIRPIISTFAVVSTAVASSIRIVWNTVQVIWKSTAVAMLETTAALNLALSKVTFGDLAAGFKRQAEELKKQSTVMKDAIGEDVADMVEANNDFVGSLGAFGKKADEVTPKVKALGDQAEETTKDYKSLENANKNLDNALNKTSATFREQKQALTDANEEAAATKEGYDNLVKTMKGVADTPTVLDVSAKLAEAQKALNEGDADAAAKAAEEGKELLVQMKQAGSETVTMLGYLATKLANVGKAAADASTVDESLALKKTRKELDELIAKKQELVEGPVNIDIGFKKEAFLAEVREAIAGAQAYAKANPIIITTLTNGLSGNSKGVIVEQINREAMKRGDL